MMRVYSLSKSVVALGVAALALSSSACQQKAPASDAATSGTPMAPPADTAAFPAAPDFDRAGSDAKAMALADKVMRQMGGYPAWQQTRLLGWDFLDGSYQLWDKQTGDFHWQKDNLVGVYNINSKQGQAYRDGQDISTTEEGKKLLDRLYPIWVNNSWWLVMPFKLKDSGVTLTYKGPATMMDGKPAEVLNMTFKNVGVTPDNKYEVLINPATNLIEEWAYFPKATDAQPAFRRRWADYRKYGSIQLASDRTDGKDGRKLDHVSASNTVPAGLMTSKTPVTKL
ncbi:hypothetical protein SAMN06265337_3326 [Hymenobacter gelipurpurascens]|uniref:Lipoprotein n=1 Tax=Hymenobacter gelipurpurascens TaxID=89968 RepID=A0A212UDK1_9BACT|nr:hypothetical protein [Hymenobacter gelipurpurascens]SNC76319.1 hypothetical protein SAMN06265337_3326 [Hymenobacter gelipurpurascens]